MTDKAKIEPVKAWGIINMAGSLMPQTFMFRKWAFNDMYERWPNSGRIGSARVIPVLITPMEQDNADE